MFIGSARPMYSSELPYVALDTIERTEEERCREVWLIGLRRSSLSRDAKLKALRNLYSYRWEEIREKCLDGGQHWERENGKKGGLDILETTCDDDW